EIVRSETENVDVRITVNVIYKKATLTYHFDLVIIKLDTEITTYVVTVFDGLDKDEYEITQGSNFEEDEPSKTGFTFAGYYTDQELSNEWQNAPITANLTLYIKWSEIIVTHTVTIFD